MTQQQDILQEQELLATGLVSAEELQAGVPKEYATLPPAPVFQSAETHVISPDEQDDNNEEDGDVLYNVSIPFSVPKSTPQALSNSILLVARQGMKHIRNFNIKLPELKLPEKTEKPVKVKKEKKNKSSKKSASKPRRTAAQKTAKKSAAKKPGKYEAPVIAGWTHKSVKPDYNSTVQRMMRVQSELKHSWQNFEAAPAAAAKGKTKIKQDWELPRIRKQQPQTPNSAEPKSVGTDMPGNAAQQKNRAHAASQPQAPVFTTLSNNKAISEGLDDIFPTPITGFFLNERDSIAPSVVAAATPVIEEEAVTAQEMIEPDFESILPDEPAHVFEGELVIDELESEAEIEAMDAAAVIHQAILEEVYNPFKQPVEMAAAVKNLPAVIEPGYHLPEMAQDIHETELPVQLMLRNNKILSNSISALAHRYFKENEQKDDVPSFLY